MDIVLELINIIEKLTDELAIKLAVHPGLDTERETKWQQIHERVMRLKRVYLENWTTPTDPSSAH